VTRLTIFALTSDIVLDMKRFALAFIAFAACSSDNTTPPKVDAPAGSQTVQTVDCATVTPAATVMTSDTNDTSYAPASTSITQGQVVKFVMSSTHNVSPFPGNDAGLTVGFGATGCLKFTSTGTFRFECSVHTFQGTVVVN